MGRKIILLVLVLLMVGSCAYARPASAVSAGSLTSPPGEVVDTIRVVDRAGSRIVMEERSLEVWATDPRQLNGLVEGQKVRLRFQQQNGRLVIYSITPLPK